MGLVEAMITLVLTAIIGLGMAFLAGRSAVAQKDMNVLGLTVGQMRNQVMNGTCSGTATTRTTLTVGANNIQATCKSQPTPIRISSDNEDFSSVNVVVGIPGISTPNDRTSRSLYGGSVKIDTRNTQ